MTISPHFGASVDRDPYATNKDGLLSLPLPPYPGTSIHLNRRAAEPRRILLRRNANDGKLYTDFEIFDDSGNHRASVKQNVVVPDNGQDGCYCLVDSDDELRLVDATTNRRLLEISKRPNSENSVGLIVSYTP